MSKTYKTKIKQTSGAGLTGRAGGYYAGRMHVRKLNEDRERFDFISGLLGRLARGGLSMDEVEAEFVCRIVAETNEDVPVLQHADANICDKLRKKYGPKLGKKD